MLCVAPDAASGERFIARGKGLAGSAGEMHLTRRDGHHLAHPKLPSPIVAPDRHGGVAVGFQFRLDGLDLGAKHELPAHRQHGAAEIKFTIWLKRSPESPDTITH